MSNKLKLSAFLLAALMLISSFALVGCSNPTPSGQEDVTTQAITVPETTEAQKSKYDVGDNVPPTLKFPGETVKIISRGRDWVNDEVTVEEDDGGTISVAVIKRNRIVEDRLGITIDNFKTNDTDNYTISNIIRNQAKTGHEYDLLANSVYATIMYTNENCFANIKGLENLDLSRPYWSQGFNEATTFGNNKQFFCTGAVALSAYRFIFATFFNQELFKQQADAPNLYDAVNDKKWTLDYQKEIITMFWNDQNADGISNSGDILGFVTNGDQIGVDPYWSSCKLPILTKDADGQYVYSLDVERTVEAMEKIQSIIWGTQGSYSMPHASADAEQQTIAKMFSEDSVAMVTLRLIEAEGEYMRGMKSIYGIIPMPMLNDSQDDYCSYAHDTMTAYAMANTTPTDKRDMLGTFLEVMASESYKTVTPTYYEVALKSRYAKDPASWEMLDIVTDKLYIDAGVLYTKVLSSIHQKPREIIGGNLPGVASRFQGLKKALELNVKVLNKGLDTATGE